MIPFYRSTFYIKIKGKISNLIKRLSFVGTARASTIHLAAPEWCEFGKGWLLLFFVMFSI